MVSFPPARVFFWFQMMFLCNYEPWKHPFSSAILLEASLIDAIGSQYTLCKMLKSSSFKRFHSEDIVVVCLILMHLQ